MEKKGFWASLFSRKPAKCCCCGDVKPDADVQPAPAAADGEELDVKVLGPGCAKCKATFAVVERVAQASGKRVRLSKVDDIAEIMRYNVLATPAVVVNGRVAVKGKVPTEAEVRQLLDL